MKRDGNKLEAFIIFSWIINFLSFHSYIEKLLNYFKLIIDPKKCFENVCFYPNISIQKITEYSI